MAIFHVSGKAKTATDSVDPPDSRPVFGRRNGFGIIVLVHVFRQVITGKRGRQARSAAIPSSPFARTAAPETERPSPFSPLAAVERAAFAARRAAEHINRRRGRV
jgi:hypothetical protein